MKKKASSRKREESDQRAHARYVNRVLCQYLMTQLWLNGANTCELSVGDLRSFYKVKLFRRERADWLEEDASPWFDCRVEWEWNGDSVISISFFNKRGQFNLQDLRISLPDVNQMAKEITLCAAGLMTPKKVSGGKKKRKKK